MNKDTKKLRIAIITQAIIILILNNIAFLFIKLEGYWITIVIFLLWILSIVLIIEMILMIFKMIRNKQQRYKFNYYALAIALIFISIGTVPYRMIGKAIYPIKFEVENKKTGTEIINSVARFRKNGTFGIVNLENFYCSYFSGTYTQKGDSLFLDFNKKEHSVLGDTLIIIGDSALYRVLNDTLYSTNYYIKTKLE